MFRQKPSRFGKTESPDQTLVIENGAAEWKLEEQNAPRLASVNMKLRSSPSESNFTRASKGTEKGCGNSTPQISGTKSGWPDDKDANARKSKPCPPASTRALLKKGKGGKRYRCRSPARQAFGRTVPSVKHPSQTAWQTIHPNHTAWQTTWSGVGGYAAKPYASHPQS
jgi:hypothetical protein